MVTEAAGDEATATAITATATTADQWLQYDNNSQEKKKTAQYTTFKYQFECESEQEKEANHLNAERNCVQDLCTEQICAWWLGLQRMFQ